ncbi:MAG: MBL fold metallo-hydrolase [Verrucomicrobiota bacterium]|nr:MBL fold metallo-hydrolase [Verrucomicrobiota bacterium]
MSKAFSRRNFLATGSLAIAGGTVWLNLSQSKASRFLRARAAEIAKPALNAGHKPDPNSWSDHELTASWLGHSTVLINFFGVNILTDPVLFSRVGANVGSLTVGPKRREAPALTASELPRIDLVLLSHAHFDHFDIPSLQQLKASTVVATAANTSDLFSETALRAINEFKWGESRKIETASGVIEVSAFQVRHWGARIRHDQHRGYNGYVLKRGGKSVLFGGDTALCDTFKDARCAQAIDLACMPIGAYNPWVNSHCNPEEAVQMANDANANYILPMHHFTFRFGREPWNEPMERLEAALDKEQERIALKKAGQTFTLPS